ncbi:MAG: hypothetical protein AB7Q37_07250 [Pyrinomonadaceae bacterium]
MFKRIAVISAVLVIFAVSAISASAQWESLGSKEVKDRSEQDTWNASGKGEFRRIKLAVQHRPVRFYRLKVTFENGQVQEIEIRNLIRAGGETRAIDLVGNDRRIDKVEVWYEAHTVRRGVRSQVTLYGFR